MLRWRWIKGLNLLLKLFGKEKKAKLSIVPMSFRPHGKGYEVR